MYEKGKTEMNKKLGMIGKGFVYGVRHPFLDEPYKKNKDMTVIDGILGDIGMSISQATIQTIIGYGGFIVLLIGAGYINSKVQKHNLKVNMVVEEKPEKK